MITYGWRCKMIYARGPAEGERIELQHLLRQAIGRVSQRAHLMLLSAQHRSVPELASFFGMSRAALRFWMRRFNVHGPAGWYDEPLVDGRASLALSGWRPW
jgi:Helix-turn-helix domain